MSAVNSQQTRVTSITGRALRILRKFFAVASNPDICWRFTFTLASVSLSHFHSWIFILPSAHITIIASPTLIHRKLLLSSFFKSPKLELIWKLRELVLCFFLYSLLFCIIFFVYQNRRGLKHHFGYSVYWVKFSKRESFQSIEINFKTAPCLLSSQQGCEVEEGLENETIFHSFILWHNDI